MLFIFIYYQDKKHNSLMLFIFIYYKDKQHNINFDVLLTVHLSIFISLFNQLDAQNLFHNKFYFMPLHVSSTCAHHQEVKVALYSLWYITLKQVSGLKLLKYNFINMSK